MHLVGLVIGRVTAGTRRNSRNADKVNGCKQFSTEITGTDWIKSLLNKTLVDCLLAVTCSNPASALWL